MNVPPGRQVLSHYQSLFRFRGVRDLFRKTVVSFRTLPSPNVRAFVSTLSLLECLSMTVMALRSMPWDTLVRLILLYVILAWLCR